ncbi:GSCOCG00000679001-RA-CDS [Cotesia congregata]|nr:GSCOCG00000679001-RA-CDS [Cotesia congregata]
MEPKWPRSGNEANNFTEKDNDVNINFINNWAKGEINSINSGALTEFDPSYVNKKEDSLSMTDKEQEEESNEEAIEFVNDIIFEQVKPVADFTFNLDGEIDSKNNSEAPKRPDSLFDAPIKNQQLANGTNKCLRVKFSSKKRKKSSRSKKEISKEQPSPSSISTSSCSPSTGVSSDEDNSSFEQFAEARPPDGGWGWVVVAAAFMVNLIADGITFSFGVIYVEFLNYFGEGKSKTAWIGSLFMAMPLLSGPVASFLTDRYGCRRVSIAGSILATLGFVISSFTSSMGVLIFTFGVVAGFGLSLCFVAAVVIVAYYFDKKRSFATGLSVCGSGIGTFIFAPVTQYLLAEYGWRGTTLILAGLFFNLAVCGCLMRDLEWTTVRAKAKSEERKRNRERKRTTRLQSSSVDSFSASLSINTTNQAPHIGNSVSANPVDADCLRRIHKEDNNGKLFSSLLTLPTFLKNGDQVPLEVLDLLSTRKDVYNVLMHNYPRLLTSSRSISDSATLNDMANCPTAHRRVAPAYLKNVRVHRHSLTYRGAMLNINRYRLRASSCPDIYRNSMTTIAKTKFVWYSGLWEFWDLLVDMLDFSHFAVSKFLLFSISNFLLHTWYDVPYVYLTDNAIEMGFSETDASILISVIGIANMFGEIFLGWAGDRAWVNASIVYALCMICCGIATSLIPLVDGNYYALCSVAGAFGIFIAANYSLTSIILVEVITLERFTNAYGLLLLVQGIANLMGPPLAGWLYDITGTYDLSFYLAGFFIALSGVLLMVMPLMGYYKKCISRNNADVPRDELSEINSV